MKNLVIIIGTIILGIIIFNLIAGDGMSVKNASKEAMTDSIETFQ